MFVFYTVFTDTSKSDNFASHKKLVSETHQYFVLLITRILNIGNSEVKKSAKTFPAKLSDFTVLCNLPL